MSTSKMVALVLFLVSFILFILVGLGIVDTVEDKYNMIALGLASFVLGFTLDKYIP